MSTIPAIDCCNNISAHSGAIFDALSSIGFVHLRNFGFSSRKARAVLDLFDQFWRLPPNIKAKYARSTLEYTTVGGNSGYVGNDVELLNENSVSELRESFNITPRESEPPVPWPRDELADVENVTMDLFRCCTKLAEQILAALAHEYRIRHGVDADTLLDSCASLFAGADENNSTSMRILHYPPVPTDVVAIAKSINIMRCGEHADYGPLTLLFQDNCGGLEVQDRDGRWTGATPVADAVLVNMGAMMERLTSGRLKAVNHRVRILGEQSDARDRYSLAYFLSSDDHYMIRPIDGSDSFPPITQHQFMRVKFAQTY